jgi:epoxyqueuosine reductase
MTQLLLLQELEALGIKAAFASLNHLDSLKEDIDLPLLQGKIPPKIADDYLQYDFTVPEGFHSLLIASCRIPNTSIHVETEFGMKEMILPTVYFNTPEANAFTTTMATFFEKHGIESKKVHLPLKLLAARTGLGQYGRNNISYVDDFGSYHKLTAFYTTYRIPETTWSELHFHPYCSDCHVCEVSCPTGIISHDQFMIDTSKCLPLPNEIEGSFPDWVKPKAHNALMGCLRCQSNCPINPPMDSTTRHQADFTLDEIAKIKGHDAFESLDLSLQTKINDLCFEDYYSVFKRNFLALYQNL